MGKIVRNGREYTRAQMPGYVPLALRATSDKRGNHIDRKYLKLSDFQSIFAGMTAQDGYVQTQENAGFHNSLYRGKDVSEYFENGSIYTKISSGKFTDLYVGDYFNAEIGGAVHVCRIAGFDVHKNTGDTALTQHTAVIVPDDALTSASMNATDTTAGAFVGSSMFTTTIPSIDTVLVATFGSHLISHRLAFADSMVSSSPSRAYFGKSGISSDAFSWATVKSMLMTEVEAFGGLACSSSGRDVGVGKVQFPIFYINPALLITRNTNAYRVNWWLMALTSTTQFACINTEGIPDALAASTVAAVRPYWLIG